MNHSSDFPPSGGWPLCPEWEHDPRTSEAAERGTRLHAVLEKWVTARLSGGDPETAFEGVPEDDAGAVKQILPYLDAHPAIVNHAQPGYDVRVEQPVTYTPEGYPEGDFFGRVDLLLITPERLEVFDAKFGRTRVDPENLPQLKIYALGGARLLDWVGVNSGVKEVRLSIGQPYSHGGPVRWWDVPVETAIEWVQEVKGWVDRRHSGVYAPSDKACTFCLKNGSCEARVERVATALVGAAKEPPGPVPLSPVDIVESITDVLAEGRPDTLTDEELEKLLDIADTGISLLKDAQKEGARRLERGARFTRWKRVAGRRSRRIKDLAHFQKVVPVLSGLKKADVWKAPEMRSLAELERVVASKCGPRVQKKFGDLWEWKDGKPVIVPTTDPRPSVDVSFDSTPTTDPRPSVDVSFDSPDWL